MRNVTVYPAPQGLFPPEVIREPEPGKFQPLPEVQGKGKEKVSEEQAAQRRTPATAEPSGLVETSSLYAELGLTVSKTDSDEEVSPETNAEAQEEGQVEQTLVMLACLRHHQVIWFMLDQTWITWT
ncbi:hypothetical protein Tco_1416301 [Tanacetum coccineum]